MYPHQHHQHSPSSSSFHFITISRSSSFSIRNIVFVSCIFALLWRPPDPCAGSCLGVTECDCELPPGGDQPIINCKSKQLTSVPVFTPSSTQYAELTLADNRIQTISDRAFSGVYFTRLDLSGNNILTFSNLAFNGVEAVLKQLLISLASSADFPVYPLSALQLLETLEVTNYSKASLPPDALLRLTNLRELRIVSSRLRNLTSDSFKGQQASLLKLSLQQNQLGWVPTSAIAPLLSLQDLDLSANQISQLPAKSFSGSVSLQSIVMDSNPLQSNVDPMAFAEVTMTLRSLSFLSCQLGDRSLDAIKSLEQLTTLNLRQNSLTNLPIDLFTHTNRLRYLILDANRLTTISRAIFLNVSLITLELRDNPLTNLPSDTFSTLTSLEELSLEGVTSLRLTPDIFVQQKRSLKILNLDRSGVGESVWPALTSLSVLETLTLTSTSLSSVPDYAFQFNNRLQTIDLSSNQINSISQLTLIGLENSLVSLKLNRNPISTLDHCLFFLFKYVDYTKLGLTGIRLQCDCSLRWLFLKTQLLDPFKQSALRWNCSNGKLLTQMTESDFRCGSPTDAPCVTVQRTTTPDLFQNPILLVITNQTSDSIGLLWTVDPSLASSIRGFTITRQQTKSDGRVDTVAAVEGGLREYTLMDLSPSNEYMICVFMDAGPDYRRQNKTCAAGMTMAGMGGSSSSGGELSKESLIGVIVGSVVGGIVVIATVVVSVVFCSRHKRDKEVEKERELRRQSSRETPAATFAAYSAAAASANGGFTADQDMPQIGSGSKRYTRNPQKRPSSSGTSSPPYYNSNPNPYHTKPNVGPETGMAFSREETDKILTILTAMRSSTSSGNDNSRYVGKPNAAGHQNVAYVNDERKNSKAENHHYDVIPGEQEQDYYNVPLDSVV